MKELLLLAQENQRLKELLLECVDHKYYSEVATSPTWLLEVMKAVGRIDQNATTDDLRVKLGYEPRSENQSGVVDR